MKYMFILLILAAPLGSCAVAPTAYGGRDGGYNSDDRGYRSRDYNDGNYHHYSYRDEHRDQGDPYQTTT